MGASEQSLVPASARSQLRKSAEQRTVTDVLRATFAPLASYNMQHAASGSRSQASRSAAVIVGLVCQCHLELQLYESSRQVWGDPDA